MQQFIESTFEYYVGIYTHIDFTFDFAISTEVASHTKPGHLIELKYVPILKIYRALDKNDSFLIV